MGEEFNRPYGTDTHGAIMAKVRCPYGTDFPSRENRRITHEQRLWPLARSRAQNFPCCQVRFALGTGQKVYMLVWERSPRRLGLDVVAAISALACKRQSPDLPPILKWVHSKSVMGGW